MPVKRAFFSEYEQASGLQRGQLWDCLTDEEKARLHELGYRPQCRLTRGAMDYLLEVFPLPDHQTELVALSKYEKQIGLGEGQIWDYLSQEQKDRIVQLGYRRFRRLPYRVILYLRGLGFY